MAEALSSLPAACGRLAAVAPGVWRAPAFDAPDLIHGFGGRGWSPEATASTLGLDPARLVRLDQVHGSAVLRVTAALARRLTPWPGFDAAITDQPGAVLTIRTADCAPVGVYDEEHRVIGAAHVGWRGLAAELPARLLAALAQSWGTRPRHVRVVIGPAIGPCCYEVGEEFAARFPAWVRRDAGRLTLDLRAAIRDQLCCGGVPDAAIHDSGVCTACAVERFHSYRREGQAAGRCYFALALTGQTSGAGCER